MTRVRILVVEDDDIMAYLHQQVVTRLGHEVCGRASSAWDAVRVAGETRPDCVLMDIHLEGARDGIETACEILQQFGIRSIFITAEAAPETRQRAAAAEPLGYLPKPLEGHRLQQCLQGLQPPPQVVQVVQSCVIST